VFTQCFCWCNLSNLGCNSLIGCNNRGFGGFLFGNSSCQYVMAMAGINLNCFWYAPLCFGVQQSNADCAPGGYINICTYFITLNAQCPSTVISSFYCNSAQQFMVAGYATCCYGYYCWSNQASCIFQMDQTLSCNIVVGNPCLLSAIWVSVNCCCGNFYYFNQNSINNGCNNCCNCFHINSNSTCLAGKCFGAGFGFCCTMILIPTNTACKVILSCDAQTFACGTNNPCSFMSCIQQFFCVCGYLWAWPYSGQSAAYSTNCGSTWNCLALPYSATNWNQAVVNGGWLAATPCESNNKVFYSPNCGLTWYTANLNSNACWAVVCNSGSNNCWFSAVNCSGCVQHIY
jgi:hypothetical protein